MTEGQCKLFTLSDLLLIFLVSSSLRYLKESTEMKVLTETVTEVEEYRLKVASGKWYKSRVRSLRRIVLRSRPNRSADSAIKDKKGTSG